jgi:hypothetical protein
MISANILWKYLLELLHLWKISFKIDTNIGILVLLHAPCIAIPMVLLPVATHGHDTSKVLKLEFVAATPLHRLISSTMILLLS